MHASTVSSSYDYTQYMPLQLTIAILAGAQHTHTCIQTHLLTQWFDGSTVPAWWLFTGSELWVIIYRAASGSKYGRLVISTIIKQLSMHASLCSSPFLSSPPPTPLVGMCHCRSQPRQTHTLPACLSLQLERPMRCLCIVFYRGVS